MGLHKLLNQYFDKFACALFNEGISGPLDPSKTRLIDHFREKQKIITKHSKQNNEVYSASRSTLCRHSCVSNSLLMRSTSGKRSFRRRQFHQTQITGGELEIRTSRFFYSVVTAVSVFFFGHHQKTNTITLHKNK